MLTSPAETARWQSVLVDCIRAVDPLIARSFGANADRDVIDGELDILAVLRPAPSFGAALHSVAAAIRLLAARSFNGSVAPTFAFQTWFGQLPGRPALHLVFHADPFLLLRLESPSFLENVLTDFELDICRRSAVSAPSVARHFDLLEKATNAMVLLLNTDPRLRVHAEEHAGRVARYVDRWSPGRARITPPPARQSLEAALEFYSSYKE
jgi:hypothetical protein